MRKPRSAHSECQREALTVPCHCVPPVWSPPSSHQPGLQAEIYPIPRLALLVKACLCTCKKANCLFSVLPPKTPLYPAELKPQSPPGSGPASDFVSFSLPVLWSRELPCCSSKALVMFLLCLALVVPSACHVLFQCIHG